MDGVSQRRRHAPRSPLLAIIAIGALATSCGPPRPVVRMGVGGDVTREHVAPSEAEAAAARAGPRAWLWEVSGGDAAAPSYVLGTMHIGITFRRALPEPLDQHLYDARVVVMEIDPREVTRFLQAQEVRRVPRPRWLDRVLPRPTWEALVAELGAIVPPEILRQIPASVIASHLQQVRMAEVHALDDGREPVRGQAASARLDMSIYEWAVPSGRPIVPLETTAEALAALESVSGEDGVSALRALVDEPDSARGEARELRDAYLSLDDARLATLMETGFTVTEREAILLGRNRAWMPNLIPEIQRGGAFVAVGVAHLLGPDSVLAMLSERGYRIRRVE